MGRCQKLKLFGLTSVSLKCTMLLKREDSNETTLTGAPVEAISSRSSLFATRTSKFLKLLALGTIRM